MNKLTSIKRYVSYCFLLVSGACLQQEIKPTPDQTTRGCLIRQIDAYSVQSGNSWQLTSQLFDYNKDGNPIRKTFIDSRRNITKIQTMEYDGLRLTKINQFVGNAESAANLTAYKTLDISNNFEIIIEHTFQRQENGQFKEVFTRLQEFFRNENGALKLSKIEVVTAAAKPDDIGPRSGVYARNEYDTKNENVFRRFLKTPDQSEEQLQYTQGGFDLNGRSPWNANIWLSYMRGFDGDFVNGDGFWNENNIALQAGPSGQALYFYNYELNLAGFPCISSGKRADNVSDLSQAFYYYYNCVCTR